MRVTFAGAGFTPFTVELDRFADHLDRAEPAFEAMARLQVERVNRRQFREQGSAETGKWAPLSQAYEARKRILRPGAKILHFDGDLEDSLTNVPSGVFEITDRGFTVGTQIDYAKYHQAGTPRMPARKLIGPPRRGDVRDFAKILQRFIIEGEARI